MDTSRMDTQEQPPAHMLHFYVCGGNHGQSTVAEKQHLGTTMVVVVSDYVAAWATGSWQGPHLGRLRCWLPPEILNSTCSLHIAAHHHGKRCIGIAHDDELGVL